MSSSSTTSTTGGVSTPKPPPPAALNIVFGFMGAGTATTFCHPLDVARVRAMVAGKNAGWISEMVRTAKTEGAAGLWTGLSAGLIRQLFYGATRFGTFETFQDWRRASLPEGQKTLSGAEKTLCALGAGAIAGVVGNPPDVALTRMTSDNKLPPELRRGYKNGFDAMFRIAKEEGIARGLMCGVAANVQRSILVNGVMLGTYAQSKEEIQRVTGLAPNSVILTFLAGNLAGFATAAIAVPADFVKTRLQHSVAGQYKGAADLVTKTVAQHGVLGLWAGFWPFWAKLAPHTTISFMVMEGCRSMWFKYT